MTNRVIDHMVSKVIQHHHDSSNINESRDSVDIYNIESKLKDFSDYGFTDIQAGGILLSMIAICERNGTSIETCLNAAYDEIRGIK